jgi:4-amino-4-deoxy-L-arabinose transferase-like glycosyltransferase
VASARGPRLAELCGIALLALAVSSAGIASHSLWTPDEPRDAAVGRAMWATGDLAVPRLNGEPFLEKPPLAWWLEVAAYRALGVSDTVARLPSALCSALTLLATFLLARRLGGPAAGWLAAGALATTAEYSEDMSRAIVDPPLVLLVTLVYAGFALLVEAPAQPPAAGRRQRTAGRALIAAGAPLAFMAKAVVGLALALGPPVLYLLTAELLFWHRRRAAGGATGDPGGGRAAPSDATGGPGGGWPGRETLRLLLPLALLVVPLLAAVAVPWSLAVAHDAGWPALRECLVGNTVGRLFATAAGQRYGHRQPLWYYLSAGVPALLPWSLALPAMLLRGRRDRRETEAAPPAPAPARPWNALHLLPACFLFGTVILSVAASKRTVYLVPLLPALAVPLGLWLDRLGRPSRPALPFPPSPLSPPSETGRAAGSNPAFASSNDSAARVGAADPVDPPLQPLALAARSVSADRAPRPWDRVTALLLLALFGVLPLLLWATATAAAHGAIHAFPVGPLHAELTTGRLAMAGILALAASAVLLARLARHLRAGTTPRGAWLVVPALALTLAYHTAIKAAVEPLKDPHALTAAIARLDPGTAPVAAFRPSETTLGIVYFDLGRSTQPLDSAAELAAWMQGHPRGQVVVAREELRFLPPAPRPPLRLLYDETATKASPYFIFGWSTPAPGADGLHPTAGATP